MISKILPVVLFSALGISAHATENLSGPKAHAIYDVLTAQINAEKFICTGDYNELTATPQLHISNHNFFKFENSKDGVKNGRYANFFVQLDGGNSSFTLQKGSQPEFTLINFTGDQNNPEIGDTVAQLDISTSADDLKVTQISYKTTPYINVGTLSNPIAGLAQAPTAQTTCTESE
jgi:hypothetical protein